MIPSAPEAILVKRSRAFFIFLVAVLAVAIGQLTGAPRAYAVDPTFTDIEAVLSGVSESSVAWGDYDSDGDLDILLTGILPPGSVCGSDGCISRIYENIENGGGTFTFTEDTDADEHLAGVRRGSVDWGDYDSDGDLDILLTGDTGSGMVSKVYRNEVIGGERTFTDTGADLDDGVSAGSSDWGDYDSDGDLDILLTGDTGSGFVSGIYENINGASFSRDTVADGNLPDVCNSSAAWGDYNSDGKPDVLLTGRISSSPFRVSKIYENNGAGYAFTEDTTADSALTAVSNSSVAWGDYDSDDDLDILLTGADGSNNPVAEIYENKDDGTFEEDTAADPNLTDVYSSSVAWGDYTSDGKPDILLTGFNGTTQVSNIYRNNGAGNAFVNDGADGLPGVTQGSTAWGDYNSDLRLDVLLTGFDDTTYISRVFRNDTATANTAPSAPANLTVSWVSDSEVTLTWDAASDTQQSGGAGLSYNVRVGTSPGGGDVVSPMALANGKRLVAQPGNAGERTSYTFAGLTPGGTYFWSAQAIDHSFAGSEFATAEGSFTVNTSFSVNPNVQIGEVGGTACVPVYRDGSLAGNDSVGFSITGGTAAVDFDYTATSPQTVEFSPDEDEKCAEITVVNDGAIESGETVAFALSNPSVGTSVGTPSAGTLTIVDNDTATISLSAASYSADEGAGGIFVTINRAGATTGNTVSVDLATADGSARAGSDYTSISQTVSFASGETQKTIPVLLYDDIVIEGNEALTVSISNPSAGATIGGTNVATLTIVDNDNACISLSEVAYPGMEPAGTIGVTLNRVGAVVGNTISVRLATADGSAQAGADYAAVSQTVPFAEGEIQKTIQVPIIDDTSDEPDETLTVSLSSPSAGATLCSQNSATLTIWDNDEPTQTTTTTTTTTPTTTPTPTTPMPRAKGEIASAKLSKKSFTAAQAKTVKLTVKFSPKSKKFNYLLQIKKGKWVKVKAVNRSGSFTTKTMTVKSIFAGKAVLKGAYRLKLSADANSRTLSFKVT